MRILYIVGVLVFELAILAKWSVCRNRASRAEYFGFVSRQRSFESEFFGKMRRPEKELAVHATGATRLV